MAFIDETTLDRINFEAKDVKIGRLLLTLLAGLFFALGWLAAKTFTLIFLSLVWVGVAIKVGWQEGRKTSRVATR